MDRHRAAVLFMCVGLLSTVAKAQEARWVSAWATAHNARETEPSMGGRTLRMIVRPTASGTALRVNLENTMGRAPVAFSAVFVRSLDSGGRMNATVHPLTFNRARAVTLQAGSAVSSDPIRMTVKALDRLMVSLDVASSSDASIHTLGLESNVYGPGGHAADVSMDGFVPIPDRSYYWLAAVDVLSTETVGSIVAFGDSWVDGRCSGTVNGVNTPDLYRRWIDVLAQRLARAPARQRYAIVNEGIAGDRILVASGNGPATLERLDRDVLGRTGATHAFMLQGMNDIGAGASANAITGAMQQVVDRVHAAGMRIVGGTLFPVADPDRARWTVAMETERKSVNSWIRTSGSFDAVIDFDRIMSGPAMADGRSSLRPEYRCDDLVHPNADGYRAMGEFVDVGVFSRPFTGP